MLSNNFIYYTEFWTSVNLYFWLHSTWKMNQEVVLLEFFTLLNVRPALYLFSPTPAARTISLPLTMDSVSLIFQKDIYHHVKARAIAPL